jgi:LacI family transcriptional regulator
MASTIHDVAQHAGVSISTVSRVLNKTTRVSEKKRQRVEAAAAALGYSPNPAARSLLSQRTGGLGVLLPFVTGEFFSEFLTAIDQITQENGHFLLISSSHRSPEEFQTVLPSLEKRVDALVLMANGGETQHLKEALPDIPMVFVNSKIEDDAYDVINFDNFGGLYQITNYLIEQGHRRIVMLKGPADSHDAAERLRGFRAAVQESGLAPSDVHEIQSEFSREAGYEAAPQILALSPRPTAVVAPNDY